MTLISQIAISKTRSGRRKLPWDLTLSKPTVDFFKRRAPRRQRGRYQRMIRNVLDLCASHYR